MIRIPVAVLMLAVAWLAWRHRTHSDAATVRRWLVQAALSLLGLRLVVQFAAVPAAKSAAGLAWPLGGLLALVAWWPLAHLCAQGFGRTWWDRWGRRPLFAFAVLLGVLPGAAWQASLTLALMGGVAFAWCRRLSTVALFRTALGALVVVAALVFRVPGLPAERVVPEAGPLVALYQLTRWVQVFGLVFAVLTAVRAFAAFVRDPSLGIRTVSRRLALSHVLVVLVPLAITIALWLITTQLGVGMDRAMVAARAFDRELEQTQRAMATAVADTGTTRRQLTRLASRHADEWPHQRVWLVRAGRVERLVGESIPEERAVAGWCAARDTIPLHGGVLIDTTQWAGAMARDEAHEFGAVWLVPLREMLAATPSRVSGAAIRPAMQLRQRVGRFSILQEQLPAGMDADELEDAVRESLVTHGEVLRGSDSARVATLRRWTRALGVPDSAVRADRRNRPQGAIVVSTATDTFETGPQASDVEGSGWVGQAMLRSVSVVGTEWTPTELTVASSVPLRQTVSGLWANTRDNPLTLIPLAILMGLLVLLLPVAAFNFAMVGGMGRSIAQATGALRRAAAAIGAGELSHRIDVKGDDELWDTARQFNRMAEGLERAREAEHERARLESELDVARRIQARLLPSHPPDVAGLEIAGHTESAREIGGDYYDHIPVGGDRVLMVIADVSGKGVPAALLMSAFRASLMSQDAAVTDPSGVASRLNNFLHRSVDPGKFVTAFVGFLEGASGRFVYANAGHNPPVLLRANGDVEMLSAGGLILGILADSPFESGTADLAPGDLLVLYTDGVTEGADATGEQWGEERLVECMKRRRAESCEALANGIVREVRAFEGESGPADDITVLVARRR